MKVEYIVNNKGELYDFKTSEEEAEIEEFKIPSIVNGIKFNSIGDLSYTFSNLYDHGVEKIKKLIIEKGIKKIASFAFSDIDIEIDTVYWAKSCTVISSHCFDNSNIRNGCLARGIFFCACTLQFINTLPLMQLQHLKYHS